MIMYSWCTSFSARIEVVIHFCAQTNGKHGLVKASKTNNMLLKETSK